MFSQLRLPNASLLCVRRMIFRTVVSPNSNFFSIRSQTSQAVLRRGKEKSKSSSSGVYQYGDENDLSLLSEFQKRQLFRGEYPTDYLEEQINLKTSRREFVNLQDRFEASGFVTPFRIRSYFTVPSADYAIGG